MEDEWTRDEKKKGMKRRTDERLFRIPWSYWKMTAVFDASHGTFLLDHISLNENRRTGEGMGRRRMNSNIIKR